MLLYLTENHLSGASTALLSHAQPDTVLLLTQNAVYLYETLLAQFPLLAVTLLEEDASVRGVGVDGKTSWTMAEWTRHGAAFSPWIKI